MALGFAFDIAACLEFGWKKKTDAVRTIFSTLDSDIEAVSN